MRVKEAGSRLKSRCRSFGEHEGHRLVHGRAQIVALIGKLMRSRRQQGIVHDAEMPPYEAAILTDAQAADIYAFIGSVPKSPDPKSIPLLNVK